MLNKINQIIHRFEQGVILILVTLMGIVVLFSAIELTIFVFKELYKTALVSELLLDKKELLKIFELFFNVLISLELFETVRLYLKEDVFHAEYILLVALIAITRKVIIIEYENISPLLLLAIGGIIFVLALGFFLVKTGQKQERNKN